MTTLLQILTPVIVLVTGASLCLMLTAVRGGALRKWLGHLALITIFVAIGLSLCDCFGWQIKPIDMVSEDGALRLTTGGYLAALMTMVIGVLLVLVGWKPDSRNREEGSIEISAEFFSMILFSLSGVVLVTMANNLIVLFLALELVSVPTYVLVTLSRKEGQAKEAGLKYFFLGAMAAALMVYGFAFLYGLSGSTQLDVIGQQLALNPNGFYVLALLLVIGGLCFKIAALPLHFYVADVYQGAASAVTAMLAFLPKLAGFYALMMILNMVGYPLWESVSQLAPISGWTLWVLAAGTMSVGNLLALMQKNVKRILAYSSVAHTGYMMLALLVGSGGNIDGTVAIYFYIGVYAVATLGAFGVMALLERDGDEVQTLEDLRGLARQHPGLAAAMTICVFSLIGMPLTAGFVGKFYVFSSLVGETAIPYNIHLLIVALINAAVAAAYYLRIIRACYLDEGEFKGQLQQEKGPQTTGIALACVLTILLGVAPGLLTKQLEKTTQDEVDTTRVAVVESLISAEEIDKTVH